MNKCVVDIVRKQIENSTVYPKTECDAFFRRRTVLALTNQPTNTCLYRNDHDKSRNWTDGIGQFVVQLKIVHQIEAAWSKENSGKLQESCRRESCSNPY